MEKLNQLFDVLMVESVIKEAMDYVDSLSNPDGFFTEEEVANLYKILDKVCVDNIPDAELRNDIAQTIEDIKKNI